LAFGLWLPIDINASLCAASREMHPFQGEKDMFVRTGLTLALLVALTAAPAQGQTNFKWKFKKGDTFYVKEEGKQTLTASFAGTDQTMNIVQTIAAKYTVKDIKDKNVILEQEIVEMKLEGIPGIGENVPKTKGAKLTVTLNEAGEAIKVEGLADLVKKASDGKEMEKAVLEAMFSEDILKQNFTALFGFGPGKAVEKGESWKKSQKAAMGPMGSLTINQSFKYEGSEKDGEKISTTATIKFAPPQGKQPNSPIQVTRGDIKGEEYKQDMYFDAKAGRLTRIDSKMKFSGNLTVSLGGMEASIELKGDATSTTKVTDKPPTD
jgi:hypothetical protein